VEYALQLWQPSEGHLVESLSATNDVWIRGNEKTLQESLTRVRAHLARVRVSGTPAGARVRVADVDRGELPLAAPVYVNAGSIVVEVQATGHESARRVVTVAAGQGEDLDMRLTPLAVGLEPASASASASTSPEQRPTLPPAPSTGAPGHWTRPAAWVAASAAAALAVGGGVALVASNHNYNTFNQELVPGTNNPRCSQATAGTSGGDCQSLLSAAQRDKTLSVIGFVGAGVLAGVSAILFVASSRRSDGQTQAVACAPSVSRIFGTSCLVRF
jgi:hypothetical protein